jgi:hypothetical protein
MSYDGDPEGARRHRLVSNEVVCRALNARLEERIEALREADLLPEDPHEPIRYLCECSDMHCRGRFTMHPDEYAAIHAGRRDCVVLCGHERPEIEVVVDQIGDGMLIVREHGG